MKENEKNTGGFETKMIYKIDTRHSSESIDKKSIYKKALVNRPSPILVGQLVSQGQNVFCLAWSDVLRGDNNLDNYDIESIIILYCPIEALINAEETTITSIIGGTKKIVIVFHMWKDIFSHHQLDPIII